MKAGRRESWKRETESVQVGRILKSFKSYYKSEQSGPGGRPAQCYPDNTPARLHQILAPWALNLTALIFKVSAPPAHHHQFPFYACIPKILVMEEGEEDFSRKWMFSPKQRLVCLPPFSNRIPSTFLYPLGLYHCEIVHLKGNGH